MNTSLRRSEVESGTTRETEQQVERDALLSALNDPDCRRILATVTSTPSTASELIDHCDLPSSTAYRKLDRLTKVNLLEERIRLRADGNHVSEYACHVSAIRLELSADGVAVEFDMGDDADGGTEPSVPRC